MGTLNEKLDYLKQTKQEIREAIAAKGQSISPTDTFRSYAEKISAIDSGTNLTTLSVTPSVESQTINPESPYNGFSSVEVSAVTSDIDSNITEENIVEGVDILGVTGTAEVPIIPITVNQLVSLGYDSNTAAYTRDEGDTWLSSEVFNDSFKWTSVIHEGGKYVAVAYDSSKAAYSLDGLIWNTTDLPELGHWQKVVYGSGVYVAINSGYSRGAYSLDGINWYSTQTNMGSRDIVYGNNIFISVEKDSYYISEDGINWSEYSLPSKGYYWHIAYGNGKYVLLKDDDTSALYSLDGINWTETILPQAFVWKNVMYGNGAFLAVTEGDYNNGYYSIASLDGINWYTSSNTIQWLGQTSSDESYLLTAMCYDGSKFIGMTRNGHYMLIANCDMEPHSWSYYTITQSPYGNDWRAICSGEIVTGTTTVDAMLNEINGEVITNYIALDNALDSINGESA